MKRIVIVLIIIGAICIGGYLYLHVRKSKDFEPAIKDKLAQLVNKATNGLYKLEMEKIEIDVTNSTVTADNVLLYPDSLRIIELEKENKLGNDVYTVSLKKLYVTGLSPFDLIKGNNIDLKQVTLDSPDVRIVHKSRNLKVKDTGNVFSKMVPDGKSWQIHNLLVQDIRLSIENLDKHQLSAFKNLTASFTDILIDSTTKNDSTRFMFARDAVLSLKKYASNTADKLYTFTIDSVSLKPQRDSLKAFGIRLKPFGNKEAFSKRLPYMKDRYDLHIKEAYVKNINWWNLLSGESFYGDELNLYGGYVSIYDDRRLAPGPKSKVGNYPHQLLMKLKFPVVVPKINIHDLDVSYEEFNPKSGKIGRIDFTGMNAQVSNVTNVPEQISHTPLMRIHASTKLMDAGLLTANFAFNLRNVKNGDFILDATLGKMDAKNLNQPAETLGLFHVKELMIDKLTAHITGSNMRADGRITFAYHDLKVDILKANDEGEAKKRGLLSFIANTFVLHKSSPRSGEKEPAENVITHNRDAHKSFFNLIWKTMADGMLKTVK